MSIQTRIQRLEEAAEMQKRNKTAFLLESGETFYTNEDPLTYLLKNGLQTPSGNIAGYTEFTEEQDPVSQAVLEEIAWRLAKKEKTR